MDFFPVTQSGAEWHVEGFEQAAKLIRVDGPDARRLSDLCLHRNDLVLAAECLAAMNQVSEEPHVLRTALWSSAIVHSTKCFGTSNARERLNPKEVYVNEPPEAHDSFEFFRALRDKHVVHDDNACAQSIPCAVLNKAESPYKIEKILCLTAQQVTLEQNTYANLKLLIEKALAWVISEFDICCELLTHELESKSYEELNGKGCLTYRPACAEDVPKNRRATHP
jgi:hypothetical protein